MQFNQILAIASGIASTLAYLEYNRRIINGTIQPNGATWLIWSVIAGISTTTYLKATGDVWKSIIPLVNVILCVWTFALAACSKKFVRPDGWDFIAIALGIISAIVWKCCGSAVYANIIIQFAIIAGFVPTWRSIRRYQGHENAKPWWIWTASYILATIVVILRWQGQWYDLVYPFNCIILHGSVAMMLWIDTQPKEMEIVD